MVNNGVHSDHSGQDTLATLLLTSLEVKDSSKPLFRRSIITA